MFEVESLRLLIRERLTSAAEEILAVFEQTVTVYEEEIDRQRRLLDVFLKPEIRLHRTELPQQLVLKEEEEGVFTDQQLCNPARDPEPPQIKEEQVEVCTGQGGEQLVLKPGDFFNPNPTYGRSGHGEDWALVLNCDQNQSAAEKEPLGKTSTKMLRSESHRDSSGVSEERGGRRLLFRRGNHRKEAKPKKNQRRTSRSTRSTRPKIKKRQKHTGEDTETASNCQPKPNDKAFKCNSCNKDFRLYTQLKSHITSHAAERPFTCMVCGKGFGIKRYLKQHMITHSVVKPYACKTCRKRFRRLEHLKIHTRSHTGERPYSCGYCKRAFSTSSTLRKHIQLHTDERDSSVWGELLI